MEQTGIPISSFNFVMFMSYKILPLSVYGHSLEESLFSTTLLTIKNMYLGVWIVKMYIFSWVNSASARIFSVLLVKAKWFYINFLLSIFQVYTICNLLVNQNSARQLCVAEAWS